MNLTKTKIFTLALVLALALAACNSGGGTPSSSTSAPSSPQAAEPMQPETSEPDSPAQQTPEDNEYGIHFFVAPNMTEEQQTFYTDYIQKLLYTGLLITNWSADDYSTISAQPGGAAPGSYLILAFEDITGADEMQKLFQQYNGEFPAEVIENVLLKYFPYTTEQLHEILSGHYNTETNTYHYEGGRGGGPIEAAVVSISKGTDNGQELIRLDYEIYTGYSGLDYTPDSYQYKTPGVLTLKQNTDGGYTFWAVEVGEQIEAPTIN